MLAKVTRYTVQYPRTPHPLNTCRATVCDVITPNTRIYLRMARLSHSSNVCHAQAPVTTVLEFQHKWTPLHLAYSIAMI